MEIKSLNECDALADGNIIFADPEKSILTNSIVVFNGKNNILVLEDGVKLNGSKIVFTGNESIVYIGGPNKNALLKLSVNNKSAVYIGKKAYFNGAMTAVTSEGHNIIIGDCGLFSFGICIRTADPHLLYEAATGKRINPSKSVFIGDHVWLGQNTSILKGTIIGSGSVLGASSVVSGKRIGSNTVWAGNPAKKLKSSVFFDSRCVHQWDENDTSANEYCNDKTYIYGDDRTDIINITELDKKLLTARTSPEKLDIFKQTIATNDTKNRFFVEDI